MVLVNTMGSMCSFENDTLTDNDDDTDQQNDSYYQNEIHYQNDDTSNDDCITDNSFSNDDNDLSDSQRIINALPKQLTKADNIYQSSNIIAQKLFNVLDQNCVCSPFSIAYIMSLIHLGSIGKTELQITNLMKIKNTVNDLLSCSKIFNTDIIKLVNIIMVNKNIPIKKDYLRIVNQLALVSSEDFSNCNNYRTIVVKANLFIEQSTNGLVQDILNEEMINVNTSIISVNTIYFKTKWAKSFIKTNTKKKKFNTVKLEMMTNTEFYLYYEDRNVQLVELPFNGNEYCMGIILPKKYLSINSCGNYLGSEVLFMQTFVEIHIPKFTQRKQIDLVPYMQRMDIINIFERTCRLDNMVSGTGAYISTMIHEAVIIVDEDGVEEDISQSKYDEVDPIIFKANHSFVYYIKHYPTNTLLFVGDFYGNN